MTTGVLETPSILNQEAKTKIKSEWSKLYGGASNAGSVAVLDAGFNDKPITIPIKDIEFISSRKMNKSEIATILMYHCICLMILRVLNLIMWSNRI